MKQIKLQVGKTYRSREGKEVRIIKNDGKGRYSYQGSNGKLYTESGKWSYVAEEHPKDLIEEVPATRHTFNIPDGVKKVTVEHVGNRIVVEMVPEAKEPKPGDVMVNDRGSVYILKDAAGTYPHKYYAWLNKGGRLIIEGWCLPGRPATPEEAQPLWDALKKAGKRWNPKTMEVEDVPEIERIREWVWANLKSDLYDKSYIAEAIEGYLNQKEATK